jgi:hypothetical protein
MIYLLYINLHFQNGIPSSWLTIFIHLVPIALIFALSVFKTKLKIIPLRKIKCPFWLLKLGKVCEWIFNYSSFFKSKIWLLLFFEWN